MSEQNNAWREVYAAILETNRLLAFGFDRVSRQLEDIKADTSAIRVNTDLLPAIKANTDLLPGIKADTSAIKGDTSDLVRAAMRADERLIRIESAVVEKPR